MGKKFVEKKIFFSILAGIMIGSATVVSANQAIEAIQNHKIKVRLNGSIQTFKDEKTGEVQYPITYHDRTYLPLRNIAQLVGLEVDYDEVNEIAILENKFDNFLDAYTTIINNNIKTEGKDSIKYELVYFNNDDIPDLMYGNPGYWTAIAVYKNNSLLFPIGEMRNWIWCIWKTWF